MGILFVSMYLIVAGLCPAICYYLVNSKDHYKLSKNARYLIPLGILPYPPILLSFAYLFRYQIFVDGELLASLLNLFVFAPLPPFIMLMFSVYCLLFLRHKDLARAAKIGFILTIITGITHQALLTLGDI